jgi:superfamily II DNA or RNA helicase
MTFIRLDLEDLHRKNPNYVGKNPFPHQIEAFEALSNNYSFPIKGYSGGLLVLPTGAGKTFTAVNWICRNVLPKKIKVIWFAQSSYLLNQAYGSFCENALEIANRESINIRVVSSNTEHSKAFSINTADDILIITTQTAILNFNLKPRDLAGNETETEFKKFVKNCANSEIFVVLDEAHHAPAYGFRNLWKEIKNIVPNFYILGLTATPTHNDKRIGGWLFKIFNNEKIYEANQNELITQKILAVPKYEEKSTGKELVADQSLYDRLVREHKDLPENIVKMLSEDHLRNDYIVSEYVKKKDHYGKTIIFADRWPQCVYIKDKLVEKGIKADAVFTKIHDDSNLSSIKNEIYDNETIIENFKKSKDGVLVNIRMLTEGVDVPDVKSVFLTRQTTSSILMTQMVGRALRGEKANGGPTKDTANIVLFMDNWKGLIDVWAHPGTGLDPDPIIRGYRPYELISIYLVEQLSKSIDSGTIPDLPYVTYLPIGWYKTEITITTAKDESDESSPKEEMQNFIEYITVFEHTKDKFNNFIKEKFNDIPESWSDEQLDENLIKQKITDWMNEYFDPQVDQVTGDLVRDLIKISRHIAKNGTLPEFHPFTEREIYDMDKVVSELIDRPDRDRIKELDLRFNKQGTLWKTFYRDFRKFLTAFDFAKNRILLVEEGGNSILTYEKPERLPDLTLTEDEIDQIKRRDNFTCQCCFRSGKGVKLEIDHILPKSRGGEATVENSQVLCSECNSKKGTNAINFKSNTPPSLLNLREPIFFPRGRSEQPVHTLARIIDFFYYCQAICEIHWNERRNGKNYSTWIVELFQGNNPELIEKYKPQLINHLRNELGVQHLEDIVFKTPGN